MKNQKDEEQKNPCRQSYDGKSKRKSKIQTDKLSNLKKKTIITTNSSKEEKFVKFAAIT